MSKSAHSLIKVGSFCSRFNQILQTNLPLHDIYRSHGLTHHVQKRHPHCVKYIDKLDKIISAPDYVGMNPKEPDSIELIKIMDENVMAAVKLDRENGYYYVASVYTISKSKIERRQFSGRLKCVKDYNFRLNL